MKLTLAIPLLVVALVGVLLVHAPVAAMPGQELAYSVVVVNSGTSPAIMTLAGDALTQVRVVV